ncbi:MAG: cohesin domain-containing protein [Candidatus Methanoperedens sp.]|nr:cohesin domain-containing protein [Candidatus Methanoperedens sp.]
MVLEIGNGYDGPEDYTRVFYESYADTRVGWRSGAKKLFVHFGDSVPHDDNLFEGISGTSSTLCLYGTYTTSTNVCSTGGDPGRNEIMDVTIDPTQIGVGNDDLDLQDVLAAMKSNNVILLEVHNSGSSSSDSTLWNNWVNRTGGGLYTIATDGTGLANAILNLTNTSASNIDTLSLVTVPSSYASWISTNPVSFTNFTIPSSGLTKTFTVTVTPPADTPEGLYNFKIQAIADGGLIGEQTVSITVRGVATGRVVKIANNYTVAVAETKAVPVQLINGSDVAGAQTTITFDPSTVTVDSVTAGDFLTPVANIDNIAGTVTIAVARTDAVGMSSATLATVTFRGVATGSSVLSIAGSSLNDASGTILVAPTEVNGKITVGGGDCGLNGDLNHNGRLDSGDATLLLRKVVGLDP